MLQFHRVWDFPSPFPPSHPLSDFSHIITIVKSFKSNARVHLNTTVMNFWLCIHLEKLFYLKGKIGRRGGERETFSLLFQSLVAWNNQELEFHPSKHHGFGTRTWSHICCLSARNLTGSRNNWTCTQAPQYGMQLFRVPPHHWAKHQPLCLDPELM